MQNLRKSFECLHQYKLKLKPCKCCLFLTEVLFLGFLVSNKGLAVDSNKVKGVLEWSVSKDMKNVESFLDFGNYHEDHIKGNIHIVALM